MEAHMGGYAGSIAFSYSDNPKPTATDASSPVSGNTGDFYSSSVLGVWGWSALAGWHREILGLPLAVEVSVGAV